MAFFMRDLTDYLNQRLDDGRGNKRVAAINFDFTDGQRIKLLRERAEAQE
jgi:hypothetical protein